jgi:hypothetical protein
VCELCVKQDKQFAKSLSDYFFQVQTCMDLPNITSLHMLVLGNSEPSAFEINDSLRDKQSLSLAETGSQLKMQGFLDLHKAKRIANVRLFLGLHNSNTDVKLLEM